MGSWCRMGDACLLRTTNWSSSKTAAVQGQRSAEGGSGGLNVVVQWRSHGDSDHERHENAVEEEKNSALIRKHKRGVVPDHWLEPWGCKMEPGGLRDSGARGRVRRSRGRRLRGNRGNTTSGDLDTRGGCTLTLARIGSWRIDWSSGEAHDGPYRCSYTSGIITAFMIDVTYTPRKQRLSQSHRHGVEEVSVSVRLQICSRK